jgi:NAD(P)-dependent dehydrogenase (short-subunit alcohol dehydrogenase family)
MTVDNLKIGITGHTGEIGTALSKAFSAVNYNIIGISRSTGFDLLDAEQRDKIISAISQCDIFINCCQIDQAALLENVWNVWQGLQNKRIINISSISTSDPGYYDNEYYQNKRKLESTFWKLIKINQYPPMTIVRAGLREHDTSYDNWAKFLINLLENPEYHFLELSYFKL